MLSIIVVAIVIALVIAAIVRQPDPLKRAIMLRRAGFGLMALSTFFFGAFIIGDTFVDPGGWKAAGLVSAWAVPLGGLAALSWFRPGWAVYVFAVLTAAVIGVSIWFALDPQGWRSFEDQQGPIRAVITFILAAAMAVLGLKRTVAAGILLLAVGVIPVAVSSLGSFLGFASLSIVSAAPVITGILYLVSAQLAGWRSAPSGSTAPEPRNSRRQHDHNKPREMTLASSSRTSGGPGRTAFIPGRSGMWATAFDSWCEGTLLYFAAVR
jgi:hypothetical protein